MDKSLEDMLAQLLANLGREVNIPQPTDSIKRRKDDGQTCGTVKYLSNKSELSRAKWAALLADYSLVRRQANPYSARDLVSTRHGIEQRDEYCRSISFVYGWEITTLTYA